MGRPSDYNEEIAEEICDTISCTPKMVETLCEENPHWPSARAIYRWRKKNEKFRLDYALAKQQQIESLVSNIFVLVRDQSEDFYYDSKGEKQPHTPRISRMRMEVGSIKWLAGKLAPKIYGDKLEKVADDESKALMCKIIDKL
jgi:hypothetical protein